MFVVYGGVDNEYNYLNDLNILLLDDIIYAPSLCNLCIKSILNSNNLDSLILIPRDILYQIEYYLKLIYYKKIDLNIELLSTAINY